MPITIDSIPPTIDDVPDLVIALNQSIAEINTALQGLSSSSNMQVPQPTTSGGMLSTFEGNAYSYTNPDTNVYDLLDPLYESLRVAQVLVSQAQVQANAIGTAQIQLGAVTAKSIAALTITGANIAGDTITADKMNVNTLSAIVANLGAITAGNITLDSSGFIRGGQTAYNTGSGFWMGYNSAAYKFSIGSSTNYMTWDGTNLTVNGGSAPNQFFLNTNGITVGINGGLSVVLGTYSGNPASLNFYNSGGTDLMGIYLNSGTTPTIQQLVGVSYQSLMSTSSSNASSTYSGPSSTSVEVGVVAGFPVVTVTNASTNTQISPAGIQLGGVATLTYPSSNLVACSTGFTVGNGATTNISNTTYGMSVVDASNNVAFAVGASTANSVGLLWLNTGSAILYTFGSAFPISYQATNHAFQGGMQFGTYTAGAVATGGTIAIKDAGGTVRQLLCA